MEAAVAADPTSATAKSGLGNAYHAKAKALRQAQDTAGGLAAAQAAVAADPENPLYQVEYGIALSLRPADGRGATGCSNRRWPLSPRTATRTTSRSRATPSARRTWRRTTSPGAEAQFSQSAEAMASWGEPLRMLAWAHAAQVSYGPCKLKDATFGERLQAAQVGCPAGPADYDRIAEAAAQYQKAADLGAADPQLAERLAVLQEVRNQLVE